MKIVLKGLMNRVGPPADNFTCALTSYMGFWVGLLQSCSRERALTTAALAGRGQAPYSLWLVTSLRTHVSGKAWDIWRCLNNVCVWGSSRVLLKHIENTCIQFLFVFY